MKYQLVLQRAANSIDDFDDVVSFEDALIELLSGEADVDGHDFGSREANIFTITSKPESSSRKIRGKFDKKLKKEQFKIAYHEIGKDDFVILYPDSLKEFTII